MTKFSAREKMRIVKKVQKLLKKYEGQLYLVFEGAKDTSNLEEFKMMVDQAEYYQEIQEPYPRDVENFYGGDVKPMYSIVVSDQENKASFSILFPKTKSQSKVADKIAKIIQTEGQRIRVQKDVALPKTNIILEKGDIILLV